MFIDPTSFCLAILDRGASLGVQQLVQRGDRLGLKLKDYDVRRRLKMLRDDGLVRQFYNPDAQHPTLLYELTRDGRRMARAERQLARTLYRKLSPEQALKEAAGQFPKKTLKTKPSKKTRAPLESGVEDLTADGNDDHDDEEAMIDE